jgi:hypothetical protein
MTVAGQDLSLLAMNEVRMQAELMHSFNFTRQLLTLNVNSVTGGDLDNAVLYGTSTTADIKQIVDIGQFDTNGNFLPGTWTTVEMGLNQQKQDNPGWGGIRYPTDGEAEAYPGGGRRFQVINDKLYVWPITGDPAETVAVAIEAYVFTADWTTLGLTVTNTASAGDYFFAGTFNSYPVFAKADFSYFLFWETTADRWVLKTTVPADTPTGAFWYLSTTSQSPLGTYTASGTTGSPVVTDATSASDIWLTKGAQYIQWASVVHLNHRFKGFVPRQEGNLPPPGELAAQGLQNMLTWDSYRYDRFVRDTR